MSTRSFFRRALAVATVFAAASVVSAGQQDLPRFTSSVELTSLDVSAFDATGQPIRDLKPDDFTVRVDGAPRRVVSAEWISLETAARASGRTVPEGYSSNENSAGGRLILLVIDQPNIRFGGTLGIRKAAFSFIDRLRPSDRAAVVGIGQGSASTPFTSDRERLKRAVERMVGQYQSQPLMLHTIGIAEAMDIASGMPGALERVINRECRNSIGRSMDDVELDDCVFEIEHEARDMARAGATDGRTSMAALRNLLTALRPIDAPKTLVLVSEGFLVDGQQSAVSDLGMLAAAARTTIYALKLDDQLFATAASEARAAPMMSRMDDRAARAEGLEILTASSRGALFNVAGSGTFAFERIESELSGYYLVGVDSGPTDKDGKAHPIRVEVNRRNVSVRARRAFIARPDGDDAPRNPRDAVVSALSTLLPITALPVRVATYSLQGPETDRVQLLIHADIGTDYPSSRLVSLGYTITNPDGRVVDNQATTMRLPPVMTGVPSALQFSSGASLPPGDYLLKFAVAEGDRVGTVEHTFTAGVAESGRVRVSDLMVGGPVATGEELLQPTVGYSVVFGVLHGYLEAYGEDARSVTAKYEIAAAEGGQPLLDAEVSPFMAGDMRAIFTRIMPIRQLPPGRYVLRVGLSSEGRPLRMLSRPFEVSRAAVLMTSASTPSAVAPTEVYLPVADTMLSRAFDHREATAASVVTAFRSRVPDAARPAFDKGIEALTAGSYTDAETSFKSALTSEDDRSGSLLAYLAATYAATGHDNEAASAWQTALVDGSDQPVIYDWLAGALMRKHDLSMARSILEEATSKWPADERFFRPMALVYAMFGQGAEAVRSLERYLAANKDDVEGLMMGVEWIYQLRSSGAVAQSPAEDLKLARSYADAYSKAKGPRGELVKQWMDFLERLK